MGAAATDCAADVVLISDNRRNVPFAISVSREARRVIHQTWPLPWVLLSFSRSQPSGLRGHFRSAWSATKANQRRRHCAAQSANTADAGGQREDGGQRVDEGLIEPALDREPRSRDACSCLLPGDDRPARCLNLACVYPGNRGGRHKRSADAVGQYALGADRDRSRRCFWGQA